VGRSEFRPVEESQKVIRLGRKREKFPKNIQTEEAFGLCKGLLYQCRARIRQQGKYLGGTALALAGDMR